ncbi:MAG: hypothetical protein ACUVX9_11605 [Anaerolineae bacterium]
MTEFPRTMVGGVSLSRLIIGTNWFLGWSHTSYAKDTLIKEYQTRERLAAIIAEFLRHGVDGIMGMPLPFLNDCITDAEQKAGRQAVRIYTPSFNVRPPDMARPGDPTPEAAFDICQQLGGVICMPHTSTTDILMDMLAMEIRNIDTYTKMIRERGMVPGLSTHLPETVVCCDRNGYDVETYIQLYNAAGFLMHVEADWVMRVIKNARKPVMTIKPMAAGRLLPVVGLAFVWSTIRDQDMVTVGCMTVDEAKEVIDISLDLLERRLPENRLQFTRSKRSLAEAG